MSGAVVVIASESGPAKRTLAEKTRPALLHRVCFSLVGGYWRMGRISVVGEWSEMGTRSLGGAGVLVRVLGVVM